MSAPTFAEVLDAPLPTAPKLLWDGGAFFTLREKTTLVLLSFLSVAGMWTLPFSAASVLAGYGVLLVGTVLFTYLAHPTALEIERRIFAQGGPATS